MPERNLIEAVKRKTPVSIICKIIVAEESRGGNGFCDGVRTGHRTDPPGPHYGKVYWSAERVLKTGRSDHK
jgi:hypothetical protein